MNKEWITINLENVLKVLLALAGIFQCPLYIIGGCRCQLHRHTLHFVGCQEGGRIFPVVVVVVIDFWCSPCTSVVVLPFCCHLL